MNYQSAAQADLRRFKRVQLAKRAAILIEGQPHPCSLINLSAGGALVRSASADWQEGQQVLLMDGTLGAQAGKLVRIEGDVAAVDFGLEPAEADRLANTITLFLNSLG